MEVSQRTYAARVTEVYNRVKNSVGEPEAKVFNEFVRGASRLGEHEKVLGALESTGGEQLTELVTLINSQAEQLKEHFGAKSLDEVFRKIEERGRTKLYIWNKGEYKQITVSPDEEKILPWGGEIRSGGPRVAATGMISVGVDNKYDIQGDGTSIVVNGHKFSL